MESITLQTSDSSVVVNDILGRLGFAASSESDGGDSVLTAAVVKAVAEETFNATSNGTSIVFSTASSSSATDKLKITSDGHFIPFSSGVQDLGSPSNHFRNIYADNIIGDYSGQLDGDLDLNNYDIVGTGNITIDGNITAEYFYGDLDGVVVTECRNDTGATITEGTPVYVSGYYSSNGKPLIAEANASSSSTMPAIGLLASDLTSGSEGYVHVFGLAQNLPSAVTNGFSVGETVYTAAGGGLTNVRPTGVSELVQNMGRVLKTGTNGRILVLGPGRSNDVPNSGHFEQLTVDGQTILAKDGGDVGIGTATPAYKLDVNGTINSSKLEITNTSTDDSLLITTTEDSSTAAPVLTFKRNSSSPVNGDYLGQLKFKGENDADQEVVYAKVTAKISDVTDTTEDGLFEFALRKAGSNNIGMRLTSTELKLLNGTEMDMGSQQIHNVLDPTSAQDAATKNYVDSNHITISAASSVDNSNGSVIQDITLDTNGHVTALGSIDLDSRYYTESEIDAFNYVDGNGTASYLPKWSDTDTLTNSVVYDDGTNIGIGTATPSATLDIVGDLEVSETITASGCPVVISNTGIATGSDIINNIVSLTEAEYNAATIDDQTMYIVTDATGGISSLVEDTSPQLGGNLDLNNYDITGTGDVSITGNVTATSLIKSGGTSSQFLKADGSVDGNTYAESSNNVTNYVAWFTGSNIRYYGGDTKDNIYTSTDMYVQSKYGMRFLTDTGLFGAGTERLHLDTSEAVFNDGGNNYDFRVEGDADANLLFTDASTDRVGIGTNAPAYLLDVDGAASAESITLGSSSLKYLSLSRDGTGVFGNTIITELLGDIIIQAQACRMTMTNPALGSQAVITMNPDAANQDFLVKGDTDTDLVFVDASTDRVGIGTSTPTEKLDVNSDAIRIRTAQTPASATATGNAGDICWDSNYIYVCVATNTWKRSAISTW